MDQNVVENALVPIADLINNSLTPNAVWFFDHAKNVFVVKSTQNIKKGDEILISYGEKCNSRLFTFYSFALENNHLNSVVFDFQNDAFCSKEWDKNKKIIQKHCGSRFSVNFDPINESTEKMFTFLRLCFTESENEINEYLDELNSFKNRSVQLNSVNLANELLCLEKIREKAIKALQRMPTSLEEDICEIDRLKNAWKKEIKKIKRMKSIGPKYILNFIRSIALKEKKRCFGITQD